MPFEIKFANADAMANRIGGMIGHITYFGGVEMPREFSAWQTDDMHRKRPATQVSRWARHQKSATTLIRPHSRYETLRSKRYQQGLARRLKRRKKPSKERARLRFSTRPILRESLHRRFIERMTMAFVETIKW
jgi:hypothetical protein